MRSFIFGVLTVEISPYVLDAEQCVIMCMKKKSDLFAIVRDIFNRWAKSKVDRSGNILTRILGIDEISLLRREQWRYCMVNLCKFTH
ncbi:MAG: hypothetical protein JRI71_09655 [Deltaproteobacteria bacterium]|nr:hypothetical protein [Deltaproteobacteria bacterium]MBW2077792.1 hypothetical protein [Deltaproteobacteria bacterium]